MDLRLASGAGVNIRGNVIKEDTEGGTGVIFQSVMAPSAIRIEGNAIALFDGAIGAERGIIFRSVAGVVNLFGSTNNIVQLINPGMTGAFIETVFFMPGGSNNGWIFVNGVPVPQLGGGRRHLLRVQ